MRQVSKISCKTVIFVAFVLLASAPLFASGFSIFEQSAKASAQAGAWTARADDAAANWYNPAAMVHQAASVQFGLNLITVGSDTDLTLDPLLGGSKISAESSIETPAQFYYVRPLNDTLTFGFGVNNPFGLVTEWADLPVTLSSKKASLATYVINPNLAWKVNDNLSLAIGLDYMYADVSDFSRVIDQSALLMQAPLTTLGESNLTGDGDDFSFNVALHYKADSWSLGLTYRGEMSPQIDGSVDFTGIAAPVAPLFPDGPGSTTLNLPAQASLGVAWDAGDDWAFEFDLDWAGWSSFESLAIDFQNETFADPPANTIPVVADITLPENWDDTFSYRFGAAWSFAEDKEFRFGALYDESPIPVSTMRPSIPDADRTSVTFGYGWTSDKWGFDAYYMGLFFDDITVPLNPLDPSVIPGTYSTFVNLLGATVSYRFQ